jgi:hypothetical protein
MRPTDSSGPRSDVISLGDEEAVKEVVWNSVLGVSSAMPADP